MKKLYFIVLCTLLCITVYSQTLLDVLYLTNGSIVKGIIFEQSDNHVKIKTPDNTVYIFQLTNIEKMEKQEAPDGIMLNDSQSHQSQIRDNQDTLETKKYSQPISTRKKRSYIGVSAGAGFPIGSLKKYLKTGINLEILNGAYVSSYNGGITARIFLTSNQYDKKNSRTTPYSSVNAFIGPIGSIPIGSVVRFDVRPMVGLCSYSAYGGLNLGIDLGASVRIHANPYFDIMISGDFVMTEFSQVEAAYLMTVNLGLAVRL